MKMNVNHLYIDTKPLCGTDTVTVTQILHSMTLESGETRFETEYHHWYSVSEVYIVTTSAYVLLGRIQFSPREKINRNEYPKANYSSMPFKKSLSRPSWFWLFQMKVGIKSKYCTTSYISLTFPWFGATTKFNSFTEL